MTPEENVRFLTAEYRRIKAEAEALGLLPTAFEVAPNPDSQAVQSYKGVAITGFIPSPEEQATHSQAVQLLRELVDVEPWVTREYHANGDSDSSTECHYCGNDPYVGHAPDCLYAKAQAFIAALDVK